MNALLIPEKNEFWVLLGGQAAADRLLELAARLALNSRLLILDCGNRANPQPLVRALRRQTIDPLSALNRIESARAFTCYQVTALLEQSAAAPSDGRPVLIFDLLASFYDESVRYAEGRRLLGRALACIAALQRQAPVLASIKPPPEDFPERLVFVDLVCRQAGQVLEEAVPPVPDVRQLSLFS